jgi:hypothetical protein
MAYPSSETLGWAEWGIDVEEIPIIIGTATVVAILPVIPDDAPDPVREGLARRRIAIVEGRCPCGVRIDFSTVTPGDVVQSMPLPHRDHCPARDRHVRRALKRWKGAA